MIPTEKLSIELIDGTVYTGEFSASEDKSVLRMSIGWFGMFPIKATSAVNFCIKILNLLGHRVSLHATP